VVDIADHIVLNYFILSWTKH